MVCCRHRQCRYRAWRVSRLFCWVPVVGLALATLVTPLLAAPRTGKEIYAALCARCHGPNGEGTEDHYPERLTGQLSLGELTKLIDETMPSKEPHKCTGTDAALVAAYIFETFYSPLAQERNRPARIELSRLTVRQYQNVVSDLVASFRPAGAPDPRHGLKAEYYKGRRFRSDALVEERLDPQVDFDFGTTTPVPGKTEDHEFLVRWEGAVFAPDSGEYEFVVRTEHAARLWVNDQEQPLIDAWVKSGNDLEYRGSLTLLGGRMYPLTLEFSKAKQGVDDSAKQKSKPTSPPASIRLLWKRPHAALEPVPSRCLSPSRLPERFVVTTPFPPDDRSVGYEKGTAVSQAWDQATTEAALEVANYVARHRAALAQIRERPRFDIGSPSGRSFRRRGSEDDNTPDSPQQRQEKLMAFCRAFVERAFRRPLDPELAERFVHQPFAEARDEEAAVKRVVVLALKSPRFLYRELGGAPNDAFNIASRLALGLWDSLPDQQLWEAASAGQLHSREQIAAHAQRMVADPRTRSKIREFLLQWLKVDQPPEIAKDKTKFPEFDEAVVSDLRTSLDLFLDEVVWSQKSDFRELLLADWLYLNGRLGRLYRPDIPADAPFMKVQVDPGQRAGVLSHPYLMAGFAYTATSSPIHRGVFIARSVLGRTLRPPPEAVAPLPVELHANLTTRERVALQTKPEACQSCHSMINPLGFTLENFDALGRFRVEEAGKPIDASGTYRTRSGKLVHFEGVRDLAQFLADSDETRSAFVEQLFHYLVKQPIRAYGPQMLSDLRNSFVAKELNIRQLAVDIVTAAAVVPVSDDSTDEAGSRTAPGTGEAAHQRGP